MSIRTKLVLLVTLSLTLCVGTVVTNAVRLYAKDSADTLYINADLLTAAKARETKTWLESIQKRLMRMGQGKEKDLLVVENHLAKHTWILPEVHERIGLERGEVVQWWSQWKSKKNVDDHSPFESVALPSGESVLLWRTEQFAAAILLDSLFEGYQEAGPYQLSLVVAKPRSMRALASSQPMHTPLVQAAAESPLDRAFQEYTWDGQTWLGAFAKLGWGGLAVLSQVPAAKAFESSGLLIQRSVWIAVFVLSLVLVAAMFFVENLVTPIGALRLSAIQVSQGNFKSRVKVQTRDELAELANSFNLMSAEIERLMIQTADKARMEKELETARHVQDTMFPPSSVESDTYSIESYYKPAAECGGDWWGVIELPNGKIIVAIGDATGHGVPSAMVTATTKATFSVLNVIARTKLDIGSSPRLMMHLLNRAIYESTRGQVLMTFFLGVFDTRTGVMDYVSASHDPIYWHQKSTDQWDVLEVNPGPRLGQMTGEKFTQAQVTIQEGDTLVLYTDGIPEAKNPVHEEWGDRRMLRALKSLAPESAAGMRDGLVQKLDAFIDKEPLHDDITLAVLRRKQRESV